MQPQSVEQAVRDFIGGNFYVPAPNQLGEDASLLDEGIIDSTGVIELINFLEQRFQLSIGDAEITRDNLDTIHRIADFVARKLARPAAATPSDALASAQVPSP